MEVSGRQVHTEPVRTQRDSELHGCQLRGGAGQRWGQRHHVPVGLEDRLQLPAVTGQCDVKDKISLILTMRLPPLRIYKNCRPFVLKKDTLYAKSLKTFYQDVA